MRQAVADAGQQIDPAAATVDRGARRHRHRAAARRRRAAAALCVRGGEDRASTDARQVVSAETAQDDWAVTNAIQRRRRGEALRQLALSLESGGVSVSDPGTARLVRAGTDDYDRPAARAGRDRGAVSDRSRAEELGGDPRVLLERLVVESVPGRQDAWAFRRRVELRFRPPRPTSWRRGSPGATCSGRRCCGG